jgi:hypothetical protein
MLQGEPAVSHYRAERAFCQDQECGRWRRPDPEGRVLSCAFRSRSSGSSSEPSRSCSSAAA